VASTSLPRTVSSGKYYYDISDILGSCSAAPVLSIKFGSAPNIATQLADAPNAETCPYGVEQIYGFPNRQYIRKEQSDFGWDWGP
jgi:beta-mannosidase